MLWYHGVLAAHARIRLGLFQLWQRLGPKTDGTVFSSGTVVPGPVSVPSEPTQMPLSLDGAAIELEVIAKHPTRHPSMVRTRPRLACT
jgi:hypothetical protein